MASVWRQWAIIRRCILCRFRSAGTMAPRWKSPPGSWPLSRIIANPGQRLTEGGTVQLAVVAQAAGPASASSTKLEASSK